MSDNAARSMLFLPSRRNVLASALLCLGSRARSAPNPGIVRNSGVPFTLDAGRILLEATFRTSSGDERKALTWFNMGMPYPVLEKNLYRELFPDPRQTLQIEIADVVLQADANTVVNGDGGVATPSFAHLFAPHRVEAMLPASLLRDHVLTLDYKRRNLIIVGTTDEVSAGTAVPISLQPTTGIAAVQVTIDEESAPFVIDAGSGYSWMRGQTLQTWLRSNPQWRRCDGAIGLANNNLLDYDFEKRGTVARIPQMRIGNVTAKDIGILGTGAILGSVADGIFGDFFWDNWQKSAPGYVAGWLGANVLKHFRLTIDYPGRMSYWLLQSDFDPHDLDQPGITLIRDGDRYFVGGLTQPVNAPRLSEASIGDELIGVDNQSVRGASKQAVFAALHGHPGESKVLTLRTQGDEKRVTAAVIDLS